MRGSREVVAGVVTGVVIAVGAAGCAGPNRSGAPEPLAVEAEFVGVSADAVRDDSMAEASVRLAADLIALGEGGTDVVVSPLSLQLALAMLREGASGQAADEIDTVAGLTGSQAIADLRAALAVYEGDVAGIDPDDPPATPLLHLADGAFVQPGSPVEPAFLDRVAAYHLARVFPADFAAGTAKPALDAWVAQETGGLLEECPIDPSRDTQLVLMNTLTFGASWRSPFDPSATTEGPFTRTDGSQVMVPLMQQWATVGYAEGESWVAVELPYTEGFAMRLLLPADPGRGPVDAVTWSGVHHDLDRAEERTVALTLPTWSTDATVQLTDALEDLGLGSLLFPQGDLDGVFAGASVSAAAQAATITVAEQGTVAAAVTALALVGSAPEPEQPPEVRFDRPFGYHVVHQETGLVLFAGRVLDPAAG